uniref:UBC core domain-containing protein n=1 Tax=Accipiter nisus TaxID=211598 RepID=A0A8B9NHB7_9AVES
MSSSQKALMLELKSLQEEPVEGFRITLVDESDLYNWEVAIFGPPNTLYEGGYFKDELWGEGAAPQLPLFCYFPAFTPKKGRHLVVGCKFFPSAPHCLLGSCLCIFISK